MTRMVVSRTGTGWTWWLQADLQAGCEVLVRGVSTYPNESACRAAAERFSRADSELVLSVQNDDGAWRLCFHDAAGQPVAVSAGRFADARGSRLELDRIRHGVHIR
jgi:hypothetical protein